MTDENESSGLGCPEGEGPYPDETEVDVLDTWLDDDDQEWEFDCHMTVDQAGRANGCELAGTEECEFDCPYRRDGEVDASRPVRPRQHR
jgi:hypothetical protein